MATSEDVVMEVPDENMQRFTVELEFVQCLANPEYLNYLAQHNYFKEEEFVNYLKYLLYWKDPKYARFIKYPQCLQLLELLQEPKFRNELINVPCTRFIQSQQMQHWSHHFRRRANIVNNAAAKKDPDVKPEVKEEPPS